jgi:hypothetical protein
MTFNKNERLRRAIHDNSRKLSLYRMRFLPHVCPERAVHPKMQTFIICSKSSRMNVPGAAIVFPIVWSQAR